MNCPRCGTNIPVGADSCPNCGKKLKAAAALSTADWQRRQTASGGPIAAESPDSPGPSGKSGKSRRGLLAGGLMLVAIVVIIVLAVKGISGLIHQLSPAQWLDDYYEDYCFGSDYSEGYPYTPHQLFGSGAESDAGGLFGGGFSAGWGNVSTGTVSGHGITGTDLNLPSFRDNYTKLAGDGSDVCTVMVYVVGSDLESDEGAASADLREMLAASGSENLNLVVQTGGARRWHLNGIKGGKSQRFVIKNGSLQELESLGRTNMADPRTLSDFITFCADNYPADRYQLILWDHGGGSVYGYGWDEVHNDDKLYISEIQTALKNAGVRFDLVGFDACLMASAEVAYMLEPYADYLIASEETEPCEGWYYTSFLSALAQNPALPTLDLGRIIIDSFTRANTNSDTLSLISLREMDYLYEVFRTYTANADAALQQDFSRFSTALAATVSFSDGYYDMFDLVDLTNHCDIPGEDELVAAVASAVKYRNDCALVGVYGLSFYFPYAYLDDYNTARYVMRDIGFAEGVYDFYDDFVSIMGGGQSFFGGFSLRTSLTGEEENSVSYEDCDWYDDQTVSDFDYEALDYDELEIVWSQEQGCYYLPLSAEDWELINRVELQVLLDNGEGFLDLGSDQYWEEDEQGNLLLNYGTEDNTWVHINGQLVAYYAEGVQETRDGYLFSGYVPARLNDQEEVELVLEWDGAEAEGTVAGYRAASYGSEAAAKGLQQLSPGDKLEFLFDLYDREGVFLRQISQGKGVTVGSKPLTISYKDVGRGDVVQSYMLIDIYNNHTWTEAVVFSDH